MAHIWTIGGPKKGTNTDYRRTHDPGWDHDHRAGVASSPLPPSLFPYAIPQTGRPLVRPV